MSRATAVPLPPFPQPAPAAFKVDGSPPPHPHPCLPACLHLPRTCCRACWRLCQPPQSTTACRCGQGRMRLCASCSRTRMSRWVAAADWLALTRVGSQGASALCSAAASCSSRVAVCPPLMTQPPIPSARAGGQPQIHRSPHQGQCAAADALLESKLDRCAGAPGWQGN